MELPSASEAAGDDAVDEPSEGPDEAAPQVGQATPVSEQDLSEDEEPATPAEPEQAHREPEGGLLEPETVSRQRTPAKPPQPSVIARFALALGFKPDGEDRFYHSDGSWIGRANGARFPWERRSASGDVQRHYYPKEHCLEREPLQIEADVWGLLDQKPDAYSFILVNPEGEPVEMTGARLRALRDGGEITIHPQHTGWFMTSTNKYKKKLIEVAIPLEAINMAAGIESNIHTGLPANLHTWWSRKPLGVARAALFASLVNHPSEECDNEHEEEERRAHLFRIVERLADVESGLDEDVLAEAKEQIAKANNGAMPRFWDPFCGGGSLPLEALRLGLDPIATDLNPVAVFITRVLIELAPKYADQAPINPDSTRQMSLVSGRSPYEGLREDLLYYGAKIGSSLAAELGALDPAVSLPGSQSKASAPPRANGILGKDRGVSQPVLPGPRSARQQILAVDA